MVDVSAFAGRLAKNYKHYSKWARRNGLDAWRLYDRDVPQLRTLLGREVACHHAETINA